MKVKVTQDHINKGIAAKPDLCPIALAVKSKFRWWGWWKFIGIGSDTCTIGDNLYLLPKEAREFISNFDTYRNVKPFEFELEFISSSKRKMV